MDKTGGAVNITVGYRGLEIALADFISAQIILRGSVFLPPPDTASSPFYLRIRGFGVINAAR